MTVFIKPKNVMKRYMKQSDALVPHPIFNGESRWGNGIGRQCKRHRHGYITELYPFLTRERIRILILYMNNFKGLALLMKQLKNKFTNKLST